MEIRLPMPMPKPTTRCFSVAKRGPFQSVGHACREKAMACKRVKPGGSRDAEVGCLAEILLRSLDKAR